MSIFYNMFPISISMYLIVFFLIFDYFILFSKQQNMTIFLMYQFILFSEEHKFQLHMCTVMIS